jgi:hypothetical protein
MIGFSLVAGVLICTPYGCRSVPYFPPPIAVRPPVVYRAPGPPPNAYQPPGYEPRRREAPPQKTADQLDMEKDVLEFCGRNPAETFCQKLEAWFRKHPEARER